MGQRFQLEQDHMAVLHSHEARLYYQHEYPVLQSSDKYHQHEEQRLKTVISTKIKDKETAFTHQKDYLRQE